MADASTNSSVTVGESVGTSKNPAGKQAKQVKQKAKQTITLPRPNRPVTRNSVPKPPVAPSPEPSSPSPSPEPRPRRTSHARGKVGRPKKEPPSPSLPPPPASPVVVVPQPLPALPPPSPAVVPQPPPPPPAPVIPTTPPPSPLVAGGSRLMQIEVLKTTVPAKLTTVEKKSHPAKMIVARKTPLVMTGPIMAIDSHKKIEKKPAGTSVPAKVAVPSVTSVTPVPVTPMVAVTPVTSMAVTKKPPGKVEKIVVPKDKPFVTTQTAKEKKKSPEKTKVVVVLEEKKPVVVATEEVAPPPVLVPPVTSVTSAAAPPVGEFRQYKTIFVPGLPPLPPGPVAEEPPPPSGVVPAVLPPVTSTVPVTPPPFHLPPTTSATQPVILQAESATVDPSPLQLQVSLPQSRLQVAPPPADLVTLVTSSSTVLPDDTIDDVDHVEVARGTVTRSFDSDSTLTASETEALELRTPVRKQTVKKKRLVASPGEGEVVADVTVAVAVAEKSKVSGMKRTLSGSRKSARSGGVAVVPVPVPVAVAGESIEVIPASYTMQCRLEAMQETSKEPAILVAKRTKYHHPQVAEKLPPSSNMPPSSTMPAALSTTFPIGNNGNGNGGNGGGGQKPQFREMSVEVKAPPSTVPKKPYSFLQVALSEGEESSEAEGAEGLEGAEEVPLKPPRREWKDPSVSASQDGDHVSFPELTEEAVRLRSRMRSVSIGSDATFDVQMNALSESVEMRDSHPRGSASGIGRSASGSGRVKKSVGKEAHRIGTLPLTDLGRWKPQDDMMLLTAIQEYRDFLMVQKHVKFTCHFSVIEIQERWFSLLYNKKVSKAACQAMRACPPDVMADVERQTPFTEAEEALLLEIPFLAEHPSMEVFELLLEANHHVFFPFRTAGDLEKHWRVMLADGRIDNADTFCVVPDEQVIHNTERILTFAEVEQRMKDSELKNWVHVSGEFAYEMEKIQRQNRERMMNLDKEIEHIRFLLERSLNYELPDLVRPEFSSAQDRPFLAILLGQHAKYGMKTGKISFGRSCPGRAVDVDFSLENYAGKVSRLQGFILLERNGTFRVENHGRRPLFVGQEILHFGDSTVLIDSVAIKVGDIYVQFFINHSRVGRYLRQKYGGEWLSEDEVEEEAPPLQERKKQQPKTPKRKGMKMDSGRDLPLPASVQFGSVGSAGSVGSIGSVGRVSKYKSRSKEMNAMNVVNTVNVVNVPSSVNAMNSAEVLTQSTKKSARKGKNSFQQTENFFEKNSKEKMEIFSEPKMFLGERSSTPTVSGDVAVRDSSTRPEMELELETGMKMEIESPITVVPPGGVGALPVGTVTPSTDIVAPPGGAGVLPAGIVAPPGGSSLSVPGQLGPLPPITSLPPPRRLQQFVPDLAAFSAQLGVPLPSMGGAIPVGVGGVLPSMGGGMSVGVGGAMPLVSPNGSKMFQPIPASGEGVASSASPAYVNLRPWLKLPATVSTPTKTVKKAVKKSRNVVAMVAPPSGGSPMVTSLQGDTATVAPPTGNTVIVAPPKGDTTVAAPLAGDVSVGSTDVIPLAPPIRPTVVHTLVGQSTFSVPSGLFQTTSQPTVYGARKGYSGSRAKTPAVQLVRPRVPTQPQIAVAPPAVVTSLKGDAAMVTSSKGDVAMVAPPLAVEASLDEVPKTL